MKVLILAVFSVLILSCANTKNSQKAVAQEKQVSTEDSLFLSFERTQCFGECPAYRITINSEGQCLYEGFKWVDRTGKHTAEISDEQMKEIRNMAGEIGFFELKDKYDGHVSDLPSTIYILSRTGGGEHKRVIDRYQGPQELREFGKFLDRMLLNLDWKKQ